MLRCATKEANLILVFQIHEAYELLSDATRRAQYDRRYVLIQRRWTQYRKWEEQQSKAEEKRRAEEEDTKRRAENADMLRKIDEMWQAVEAERLKRQEDAKQARSQEEAEAAQQHDTSAITPCVHPHIGAVWWKNGKADCSFCGESETYCFRCPVCDVAACHDCREDIVV